MTVCDTCKKASEDVFNMEDYAVCFDCAVHGRFTKALAIIRHRLRLPKLQRDFSRLR
jgi:hypothetical protein